MYCPDCGTQNPDDAGECRMCHRKISNSGVTRQGTTPPVSRNTKIFIVIFIMVIVSTSVIAFLSVAGNSAQITVNVHSLNNDKYIDVTAYIEYNIVIEENNMPPGHYVHNSTPYVHYFSIFDNSSSVRIFALSMKSTGPGIDSEQVIVKPGGHYTIDLYV